ncbi:MAG: HNH endonuclease [Caldilineaceae bacterium SB0661_bin_32]|uniref:HNH endonuclease n=1 Tax=Caldilineaceae bacterium SB0661_bin_32 TaxID=2605255 RepID=A0A6B1D1L5_9CHLR|nr:HNH endonuclease [Caldilineaceae bacterium SB0661_bin_32]
MSTACNDKRCADVVRTGACSVCGTQRRPRRLARYDKQWHCIRNAVLAVEPLCRHCAAAGRVTAVVLVDHIVPLQAGTHDRENLQPLCQRYHAVKTASERQREG